MAPSLQSGRQWLQLSYHAMDICDKTVGRKMIKKKYTLYSLVASAATFMVSCTSAPVQVSQTTTVVIDRPLIQNLESAHQNLTVLKQSLVRFIFKNNNNEESYGTGFFFQTRDLVVSSLHVFEKDHPCLTQKTCEMEVGFAKSSQELEMKTVTAEVALKDVDRDLIFLKIKNSGRLSEVIPLKKAIALNNSNPNDKKLVAAGFYQDEKALTFSHGKEIKQSDGQTLTSIVVGHGFSGSPVLNEKGEVLGVVSSFNPIQGKNIGLARFVEIQ